MNIKKSSKKSTQLASSVLRNSNFSAVQRKLAGSTLAQAQSKHQTGKIMERIASKVLSSSKYNKTTKALAGTVLSQSNKKR